MILKRFRITNFRSIIDSGWVDCQNITVLSGGNESGKSNIMRALWKFNTSSLSAKIGPEDMPTDVDKNSLKNAVFATVELALTESEREVLSHIAPGNNISTITVTRSYNNALNFEYERVREEYALQVANYIKVHCPKFIYYSSYSSLDSSIYLPQMLRRFNGPGIKDFNLRHNTVTGLLYNFGIYDEVAEYAKTLPDKSKFLSTDLRDALNQADIADKLADGEARVSENFSEFYGAGRFNFQLTFVDEKLDIMVTDKDGITTMLSERSNGFQWYFSFCLSFNSDTNFLFDDNILLFDEEGMALHPINQKAILQVFEKIGKNIQFIYTTYSANMLPSAQFNRVRTVYKNVTGHTCVDNVLMINETRTNEEALFVPMAAVGFEIVQMIFAGCFPVIVMNSIDQFYLNTIKNYLISAGEFRTSSDILFIATGENGIDGAIELTSAGSDDRPVCVLDSVHEDIFERLRRNYYTRGERDKLIALENIDTSLRTFEDLFPPQMIYAFNAKFIAKIAPGIAIDNNKSIIPQIEQYAQYKGINLPYEYRTRIARTTKKAFADRGKDITLPARYLKIWKILFGMLD